VRARGRSDRQNRPPGLQLINGCRASVRPGSCPRHRSARAGSDQSASPLNTTAAVAQSASRPSISQPAAQLPSASVSQPGMMLASRPRPAARIAAR
jgi:hypothetical protein